MNLMEYMIDIINNQGKLKRTEVQEVLAYLCLYAHCVDFLVALCDLFTVWNDIYTSDYILLINKVI